MTRVKTYPELNTAALCSRQERALCVWYLLRHIDKRGSGLVREETLADFVTEHKLFSRDTLRRALRKGDGTFWRRCEGFIEYRSLFRVAEALGAELHKLPVLLDIDDFRGIGRMRAAFMSTMFADKPRRMSRAALAAMIGKSAQTTRNYAKRTRLHVKPNSMLSTRKVTDLDNELRQEGYYRTQVAGQTRLARRLPNTYHAADLRCGPFGQVKHLRKACFQTRRVPERRYFASPTAAARALHRAEEGKVIYLNAKQADVFGATLWHGMMLLDGVVWSC